MGSAGVRRRDDPVPWEKCHKRGSEPTSDPRLVPTPTPRGLTGEIRERKVLRPRSAPRIGQHPRPDVAICEIGGQRQVEPDAHGRQVDTPPPSLGAGGGRSPSGWVETLQAGAGAELEGHLAGERGSSHPRGDLRPGCAGLRQLGGVFQAYVAFPATCLGTATSQM